MTPPTMKDKVNKANAAHKVTIKIKKEEETIQNKKLAQAVCDAYGFKGDADEAKESLKTEKDLIIAEARRRLEGKDAGTVTFMVNGIACKVSLEYSCDVPEENVKKLQKLLGDRWDDLVKEKTKYTGRSALIDLVSDADNKIGKKARKLVEIKEAAPKVSFDATNN